VLKFAANRLHIFDRDSLKALLSEYFPLLSIMIGIVLISITIGPFQNPDTQLEFNAASGVLRWGMPYVTTVGNIINQPPIGFYIDALFFGVFGLSFDVGAAIITLFGLGCTFLVYQIGKFWYGKTTGLFAAALFALTPWQLALSRIFFIDAQCLFFSLLFFLVGIHAIRKDSLKLFMVSGTIFAIALLTKLFAVFTLIPLALFYFYHRQTNLKRATVVGAYFLPAIFLFVLWYQIISGQGVLSVVGHDDFSNFNSLVPAPSIFFLSNFLGEALGITVLIVAALSVLIGIFARKKFATILCFDLICLVSVVVIGSINVFMAVGLNLVAPYFNPIKYDYQFLPFVSLLAASLVGKGFSLAASVKSKEKLNQVLFFMALAGLVLLAMAFFYNMSFVHEYSTWDHWIFRVDMDRYLGYSFLNLAPIGASSFLMGVQNLGFTFVFLGLAWAIVWTSRAKLGWLRKKITH
jgi:4-amino-4-deoxy-L-arabinose transferase-like glycosyltransferase